MKNPAIFCVALLLCSNIQAEPELKGTPSDLSQFLGSIPKTVSVSGEGEIRVPAHRAVVTLKVVTENKSLQEALRANGDLRSRLAEHLKKQGVSADRIHAAKFSSTPKFGIFSEKARSYRVENEIRVAVEDEKELQRTLGTADLWPEVQYAGVDFEYADKESLKQKAISQACDNALERRKIYEEKFGLKLVPVSFSEGAVMERNATPMNYAVARLPYGSSMSPGMPVEGAANESVSSFGEMVCTARVTVNYTAQAR